MEVTIERDAGFCPGVVNAIKIAEQKLIEKGKLYCLGDIVHNAEEIKRLTDKGLEVIELKKTDEIENAEILIRSHGVPPETYEKIRNSNNSYRDATCNVVKNLQRNIAETYQAAKKDNGQIVIYGKKNHPEVIGLSGQCNYEAVIIENQEDINKIDADRPVYLFAQTTKNPKVFKEIKNKIQSLLKQNTIKLNAQNTICKWMINRVNRLKYFAKSNDLIIFVAGEKSSNGQFLFDVCKHENPNTKFISSEKELENEWLKNVKSVGVSGATSTPVWLLEKIAAKISKL